jgi:hypothetical protein
MSKTIETFKGNELMFHATHVIEFFHAPLPADVDGQDVTDEADLFRASNANGFEEIYLANGESINAECSGKNHRFRIEDFLRWQLERVSEETLWQLISKTDASVTELLDSDAEYEKDSDYDPENWLSVYAKDEYPGKAVAYIRRLREEVTDEFYKVVVAAILDERYGLLNTEWYETEIDGNLEQVRFAYGEWQVPLMIVSMGKFFPYISKDYDTNLMMEDYKINNMFVRNYDEGDVKK